MTLESKAVWLLVVGILATGCSHQPITPTDDSRTKAAFAIWEWSLPAGYDKGLRVVSFDGETMSDVLTFQAEAEVRCVYLQKSTESGKFVIKIDAGNDGYYGGIFSDPFSGRIPRRHKTPVKHDGMWVLVNDQDGIAGSDGKMSAYVAISFTAKDVSASVLPAEDG